VIGDVVNVAQRIESLCRQYPEAEFIVGESTYVKIQHQLQGESLPPLAVKGRAQPVSAYQMRRPKAMQPFALPPAAPIPDLGAGT
jgi:class 3 adenylate cyclase